MKRLFMLFVGVCLLAAAVLAGCAGDGKNAGIKEKEDAKDNNRSSATLIISIKTGSIILYTGVTISCIAIILAGAYMIKKKVLNRVI